MEEVDRVLNGVFNEHPPGIPVDNRCGFLFHAIDNQKRWFLVVEPFDGNLAQGPRGVPYGDQFVQNGGCRTAETRPILPKTVTMINKEGSRMRGNSFHL